MNDPRIDAYRQAALKLGHKPEDVDAYINAVILPKIQASQQNTAQEQLATQKAAIGLQDLLKTPEEKAAEKAQEAIALQEQYARAGLDASGKKPENKQSEDDKKRQKSKETAERIISQLEAQYFGQEGSQDDLSSGRIGGVGALLSQKAGLNTSLNTYKALRRSAAPTLARAAGDVGNLSEPEQKAAIMLLPTEFSTPEEAKAAFAAIRQKFGLSEVQKAQQAQAVQAVQQAATPAKRPTTIARPDEAGQRSILNAQIQAQNAGEGKINPLMDLLGNLQTGLGNSEALPVTGSLLGRIIGGGNAAGTGAGAAIGEYLKQGLQEGGVEGLLPNQKKVTKAAVAGGTAFAADKVFTTLFGVGKSAVKAKSLNPSRIALAARDTAVEQVPVIKTDAIIKAGDRAVKLFPHAKEDWDVLKPVFTKEMPTKDLLDVLTSYGSKTYTASGTVKDKVAADLFKELLKAGRSTIREQAPEVAKQTSNLRTIIQSPKMAQKATWLALKTVGLGKLLGL